MQNFQGIAFIWTQTYGKLFQICISVPLIFYRTIASLNFIHKLKLFLRIFNLSYFLASTISLPYTEYMSSIYWLPHIFWLPSIFAQKRFFCVAILVISWFWKYYFSEKTWIIFTDCRSSPPDVFLEKGVPKICSKFTVEYQNLNWQKELFC